MQPIRIEGEAEEATCDLCFKTWQAVGGGLELTTYGSRDLLLHQRTCARYVEELVERLISECRVVRGGKPLPEKKTLVWNDWQRDEG